MSKIIGKIIYYVIGSLLPDAHQFGFIGTIGKAVRSLCGKLILAKCGKNVNIYRCARFSSSVELGHNSDIGYKATINGKCIIGNNVIMGPYCTVYTHNHNTDRIDVAIKYQGDSEERPVYIGDDSWIGSHVIILPGVHIGKGCVIGAGSVVPKDIPDYAVAAGNPCKVVKMRGRQ